MKPLARVRARVTAPVLVAIGLGSLACVLFLSACAGGRPRIRLHGWPDDIDLAEVLENIVDRPGTARSHAPSLVWTKEGAMTKVDDPRAALASFRSHIKEAVVPPRDATPRPLRCDVARYRCLDDTDDVRTTFFFAMKGEEGKRYIVLERMESAPRPK